MWRESGAVSQALALVRVGRGAGALALVMVGRGAGALALVRVGRGAGALPTLALVAPPHRPQTGARRRRDGRDAGGAVAYARAVLVHWL